MFDVLKLILKFGADLITMLFNIDLGPMSLGTLLCIISIFFPIVLSVVGLIKFNIRSNK